MSGTDTALGRREMLQRLAMSIGGIVSVPFVASAHPIQEHLRHADTVSTADVKAHAATYAPAFLDDRQLDTLRALAERIVPGSTQAKSAEFIDQLLTVSSTSDRGRFVEALTAFDALAAARTQRQWAALPPPQQDELLAFASTEKPGAPDSPKTIRDQFEHLKGWIVGAYYSSEPGMRELGWTGRVFFPAFPGCDHPDGHR